MTFRARLFLAIFAFAFIPLAYVLKAGEFVQPVFIVVVFALCAFVLVGALAGAMKVDELMKQAENRALRSEVELQIFMERVQDGVFSVGPDGKVREINTAMAQMLRHDPDFLKGRNLWEHLQGTGGAPGESIFPPGQVRVTMQFSGKVKTGGTVDLLVDLYLQKHEGRFDGFRGCARLKEKAVREETLRASLAVDIFRIIRNRVLEGIEEIRAAASSGAEPARMHEDISGAAGRLLCALAPCLQENATAWVPKPHPDSVAPKKLLELIAQRHAAWAELNSVTLTVECIGEPAAFMADPRLLHEALSNLVDNAVKYSPKESEVHILFNETAEKRSFVVWDAGIGWTHEESSRLFTPFFRVDNPINARIPGLGLGLWTAQRIVEAHKGILYAESEMGKGATFTISLFKKDTDGMIRWID